MFAISYNGEIDEEITYNTVEEARLAIAEEVRDACREDVLYGTYSEGCEASYWNAYRIVKL